MTSKTIKNYVDKAIEAGRKSNLKGWVMSDILEQVYKDFDGQFNTAVPQARKYIVEEVSSITENQGD